MYDILFFDADETLFDFVKSQKIAFQKTMADFNLLYSESIHLKRYDEINQNLWRAHDLGLISQEQLKVERFNQFRESFHFSFDAKAFSLRYLYHLGNGSYLYDESASLILSLSKNYRMGIITNGLQVVQESRICKSEIASFFETIVISEVVGFSKPNPRIFEIAMESMAINDKKKVLMIGDRLGSDIKGGNAFGIDTCWYNPKKQEQSKEIIPTYEIDQLSALLTILK